MEELKKLLEELKMHFEATVAEIKGLVSKQDEEIKAQGASSSETATKLEAATKAFDQVTADLAAATKRLDEMEAASKRLPQDSGGEQPRSIGQQFVESEAYKRFDAALGKVSDAVLVKTFFPRGRKAVPAGTLTGASLGDVPGYLYPAARVPGIIAPPELQPRVRDLFPVVPTGAGAVEFVRETGFLNAAAATAEGEAKPQSYLEFELISMSARTIAHWLPATRQILADATGLQSYIDTRLLYGLMLTEDAELLYGDGTGVHIAGILTDPGIQLYTQVAGDNKADAVRRAMTLVTLAGYPASGVIVHPNDWEDIELMKDSDGRYIWVMITVGGERRLWRAPVVESQAIHEGEFAVGAFNLAAAIWDREEALVRISDQHEDFFTRNMVAILAEERLMLTVYRPEAIVLGSFTAEGS